METPSREVLASFELRGEPALLAGGEGLTFRVDDVVVKRVIDKDEADWVQALLHRIEPDAFRIAEPVAAVDGRWVHDGWIASRFIADLRPAAPAWADIVEAGLRFCAAAERAREGERDGVDVLARRAHRWAIADRVAWGEHHVELSGEATDLLAQISVFAGPPSHDEHFVHGDLSGNVFLDAANIPVILDVSPYLRSRRWAAAIVVADAVLWEGADTSLAHEFATDAPALDLLARALIFRLVAEQLADNPRHHALLAPYRNVLAALR